MVTRGIYSLSLPLPIALSLFLPLPLPFTPLSNDGAGSEGFPEPLEAFVSSAAKDAAECDC